MILDQRSEVETFFLEALEQVKYEYKKREIQEKKKGLHTGAMQEVFYIVRFRASKNMETKLIYVSSNGKIEKEF